MSPKRVNLGARSKKHLKSSYLEWLRIRLNLGGAVEGVQGAACVVYF